MTPKQNRALAALLTAPSKAAAAQAAGISPRTLRDYLADPTFRQEYQKAFVGLVEDATRQAKRPLRPRHFLPRLEIDQTTDILTRLDELEKSLRGDNAE